MAGTYCAGTASSQWRAPIMSRQAATPSETRIMAVVRLSSATWLATWGAGHRGRARAYSPRKK